jgi:hypothetical protein
MKKRTRKNINYAFSFFLSLIFFVAGSRVLYADYRQTTTVTTTSANPNVSVPQPSVVVDQPAVVERRTVVEQPAVVTTQQTLIPSDVIHQQVHNFITYDINVKKVFQSNENIQGSVVVNNASATPLADSFHIRLYQNGHLYKELITRMTSIPPGQTRFSLHDFGIPQINDTTASQGDWTISIYDLDPAYSKTADFRIINSTSSNNILR